MTAPTVKPWVAALDGTTILAVQHGCGFDGQPVNCYIDEYRNWVCPNCMATYGAVTPLQAWYELDPELRAALEKLGRGPFADPSQEGATGQKGGSNER